MNQGVRSTDQWREHRALLEAISRNREEAAAGDDPSPAPAPPQAPPPPAHPAYEPASYATPMRDVFVGGILLLVAALWIAAVGATLESQGSPLSSFTALVSLASGPLALLGVVFVVLQRTSRREAVRFGQTAQAMRTEAAHLEQVVGQLSTRIADNRHALADHAQQLLHLGEDTTLRLGEIAAAMARENKALRVEADHLETAAEIARSDMGVLIDDLPRVDDQIRGIIARLRESSGEAAERISSLQHQLGALAQHGQHADVIASTAANKLAEQIALINDQGALVDQRLDTATTALVSRVDELGQRIDSLSTRLSTQDQASQLVLGGIDRALDTIEARFAEIGSKGDDATRRMGQALADLREQSDGLTGRIDAATPATEALVQRAVALKAALDASTAGIDDHIPAALAGIEQSAGRSHAAIAAIIPEAAALERVVATATSGLTGAETAIAEQRAAIEAMHAAAEARLADIARQSEALQATIAEAEKSAQMLANEAGPQLVEALLRVRETAAQAAEGARESIGQVIPAAAASLGAASREAMGKAMNETLHAQLGEVSATAERAVAAAASASERLQQQLASIKDTAASVDARLDEVRAQVAESDEESFSRRVALLVESLNSTAIDVAKILSNDVTDSAWTSYLKGDRSVFTRRAVRLIDTTDAREIAQHYGEDTEFREQVNRYIHDFEAMLRRVLASRDGAPLSVTLLSSDMGKLYVALAQAIERLRT
ncbi:hypothetical protein [Sphingomonas sp. KC8]|uniref:hypothetical protein n=1 Tax=Sphingomonas sp. KC8 TaxID=1030157 RepID=UPI0002488EC3|nr:hypothetical protein [Sphingomonas sp. KC8]ARS25773.1 hypothetical protein KC8_00495 [Sphingomonas sp. KC8]